MTDSFWELCLWLCLILAVSGLVQGVLGFGFGIVAMTVLPLLLGFRDGVTFLAVVFAVLMPLAFYWQKQSFNWHDARHLIYGSLVGIPLGALLVGILPERVLYLLLGAAMALIGAGHFLHRRKSAHAPQPRWELPIGMIGGVLSVGFNMGGPPVVAYAYSRNWTGEQAKAVLTAVFLVTSIMRLGFIGFTGVRLTMVLELAAVVLLPTALILRGGIALGRKAPHDHLRPLVFAYLGLAGLYYLFLHR